MQRFWHTALLIAIFLLISTHNASSAEAVMPVRAVIISYDDWVLMQKNKDNKDVKKEKEKQENAFPFQKNSQSAIALFDQIDVDHDRRISKRELAYRITPKEAQRSFHKIDMDQNGYISVFELDLRRFDIPI